MIIAGRMEKARLYDDERYVHYSVNADAFITSSLPCDLTYSVLPPTSNLFPPHRPPFPLPPLPKPSQGLLNCSFLKNIKNPTGITTCAPNAIQNHGLLIPCTTPLEKSGNTSPGPSRSGAVAFATIVTAAPRIWLDTSVTPIWIRVSVCRSIMPKPTPCTASRTPSQSHSVRPARAPATGPPGIQGTQRPKPEVPQSIWAQRGAPRPMAKMGRIQECARESLEKMKSSAIQTKRKKTRTRRAMVHWGA